MLIRADDDGAVLISQPAHAWISGQLARAWTEGEHGSFVPHEEVCLAAEQHDIGWLQWEVRPTLNPDTGLPYSFREMPRESHVQIWGRARRYAMIYGRYPALLISMHGTGLFERFGPSDDAPRNEKMLVDTYLRREYASQRTLVESLAADSRYEGLVEPDVLERNRSLISLWDGMSLMICSGVGPDGASMGEFALNPGAHEHEIRIDPWPLRGDSLTVFCEARRIHGTFERQTALHGALNSAAQFTIEFELLPAD